MSKLRIAIATFLASLVLSFGLAVPVMAQANIQGGLCAGASLQFTNPENANCNNTSNATQQLNNVVRTIVNLLSAVVGVVAVIMIIFGGLRYVTSGSNDASVTSAKNTILYAIIGLIIAALAQILVRFTLSKVTNA